MRGTSTLHNKWSSYIIFTIDFRIRIELSEEMKAMMKKEQQEGRVNNTFTQERVTLHWHNFIQIEAKGSDKNNYWRKSEKSTWKTFLLSTVKKEMGSTHLHLLSYKYFSDYFSKLNFFE